jgi:hypothetical protein
MESLRNRIKEKIIERIELEFVFADNGKYHQSNYLKLDHAELCCAEILEFLEEESVLEKINDDILQLITTEFDIDGLIEWAVLDCIARNNTDERKA